MRFQFATATYLLAVTAMAADPTPRETGDRIAGQLFADLMSVLQEKIKSEGPEAAINYCRLQALPLTAQVVEEFPEAKTVRRTALRVRNPANTPDATDRSVLGTWLASWNPSAPPQPVLEECTAPDGTKELRYYRPVPVMATCLACHGSGDEISPAVRAALKSDYPGDEAVGFKEGDLRGAIVVTFEAR